MIKRVEWVLNCMDSGPSFDDGNEPVHINCRRQEGHLMEHEWWSDDGNIRLTWRDEWTLGPGPWRNNE